MQIYLFRITERNTNRLIQLYNQFYEGMINQGLRMPLVKDGARTWLDSSLLRFNKVGIIYQLSYRNQLVGFISGYIKLTPSFLGNRKIGFIDAMYILPDYRGTDNSILLYKRIENWFKKKNVDSLELHVLLNNLIGHSFWQKVGFQDELIQMRKLF